MIIDVKNIKKIITNIIKLILILLCVYIGYKFAIFYMPFLIAFIISLLIEPIIRMFMKKMNLTRRTSSIIIFIIVSIIIISIITAIITSIFSETSGLLKNFNNYVEKIYNIDIVNRLESNKIHLPNEIKIAIQDSTNSLVAKGSDWLKNSLTGLMGFITSIPKMTIYFIITIMALYFMCVDRIYILDQVEHHFPEKWVFNISKHTKELTKSLGEYLKAECILIFISFMISLIGLYLLKFAKFNIEFPLLMALFIGFVDALPILGSGTVMVPWAIISALNGDLKLGIAILILLVIMSITRQFLEPKLVSKHIGTHPIFTLIAMYTGFKLIGVFGMIVGPIILIIIKNIFSNQIDKGIIKEMLNED